MFGSWEQQPAAGLVRLTIVAAFALSADPSCLQAQRQDSPGH